MRAELSHRRRLLVLAICCMSILIAGMDITIVNVALPSIRADMNASVSALQWIVDACTVALASFLIVSGSMADRLGRQRTFQVGLAVFTIGSLLCSVAPDLGWLIAFRTVQAIGGSMLNPVAMSIVTNVFTDARERAQAIGIFAGVGGVSLGVGPMLGGVLVDSIGWRSIFWVNVPVGVAAIVVAAVFIPESKAKRAKRLDPIAQLLVIVVLVSLTYSIIEAPRLGRSLEFWGLAVTCLGSLIALLRHESRRSDPLIDSPSSGAFLSQVRTLSLSVASALSVPSCS